MKLTVLIPVYNEEKNLPLVVKALDEAMANEKDIQLELLFVDDGSRDTTLPFLRTLASQDARVRVVSFSRNFGGHAALLAGLQHSSGDVVVFIAADMQDPPELVPLLLAKWREGNRIVWGAREKRDDPFFTILFSRLYSSLMRRLALTNMPPSGVDVCMIDRRVIDEVLRMQEKNTSLIGLIMWSGYNQAFVPYQRRARAHGESKWTLAKKLKMFVDSFVSFSFFPIRMVSYLGLSISMLGFAYALFIIARRIVYDTPIVGWSSLMVAITTLSGIQLIMLGVVAEYLWRTFDETRRRPPYIVNELIGFEDNRPRPFERRKS